MLKTAAIIIIILLSLESAGICKTETDGITEETIAVLNFTTKNCNPKIGTSAGYILSRELSRLSRNKKYKVMGRKAVRTTAKKNKFKQENCYDDPKACTLPADKKVIGLIDKSKLKTGEKQLSKYVTRELIEEEYSINVRVMDKNNRVQMDFKEITDDINKLKNILKKIAVRIANKYGNIPVKKPEKEKPVKKKPVIKRVVKKPISEPGPIIKFKGISAAGSCLKGIGKYNDIADTGYGANINMYISIIPFPNHLVFSSGFYLIQDDNENIKSNYIINPLLKLGHFFRLGKNVILCPYVGGGYLISIIYGDVNGMDLNGNYDYSREYYYNPLASAGFEINYRLIIEYYLLINPSYSIFFEKDGKGQFLTISLGIKTMF